MNNLREIIRISDQWWMLLCPEDTILNGDKVICPGLHAFEVYRPLVALPTVLHATGGKSINGQAHYFICLDPCLFPKLDEQYRICTLSGNAYYIELRPNELIEDNDQVFVPDLPPHWVSAPLFTNWTVKAHSKLKGKLYVWRRCIGTADNLHYAIPKILENKVLASPVSQPEYRNLKVGEVIQTGDQFYNHVTDQWEELTTESFNRASRLFYQMRVVQPSQSGYSRVRRPIDPADVVQLSESTTATAKIEWSEDKDFTSPPPTSVTWPTSWLKLCGQLATGWRKGEGLIRLRNCLQSGTN